MTFSLFACVPFSSRLSSSSCAKRHVEASAAGKAMIPKLLASACVACPVGEAHAKGETPTHWPDGTPIVRLGITPRPSVPATVPAPKESPMLPARMITFKGETLNCGEWGKRLGVSGRTVALRDDAGKHPDGTPREDGPKPRPKRRSKTEASGTPRQITTVDDGIKPFDLVSFARELGEDVSEHGSANGVTVLLWRRGASATKAPRLTPARAPFAI